MSEADDAEYGGTRHRGTDPSYRLSREGRLCAIWGKFVFFCLPVILIIFLSFLGALIFHSIEEPLEQTKHQQRMITDRIYRQQWTHRDKPMLWSFWGSFVYALSLFTTVGYPLRVPTTQTGRTATALYFCFAFPLYLLALHIIGRALAHIALLIHGWVLRKVYPRSLHWKQVGPDRELNLRDEVTNIAYVFPLWLLPFILFLHLLISAGIIVAVETSPTFSRRHSATPAVIHYGAALWYYFNAWSTVGLQAGVAFRPESEIAILVCVLIGFILLAMFLHLVLHRLEAIKQFLHQCIDERYIRATWLGRDDAGMPADEHGIKNGLRVIVKRQSLRNRFWSLFLSHRARSELTEHWRRRAGLTDSSDQTQESSFESRLYGVGSKSYEFHKSHDDVNSLVAMLDTTLNPFTEHPAYRALRH